jgi:hypothetical protein
MKLLLPPLFFAAVLLFCPRNAAAEVPAAPQVVEYPAPEGALLNNDFSVRVRVPGGEWKPVATYVVKVDEVQDDGHHVRASSMAFFDFAGTVEVEVTSERGPVSSARVRPLSYGIPAATDGKTVTFTLNQPRNLSVEVNGNLFANLQLFANPLETERPDPNDPNVIYFGPGLHRPSGIVRVPSGKTLYLAGGAVLRGRIVCDHAENVRILGRGMVEQNEQPGGVRIANSRNVEVSGIFTPQCFTGGSEHVVIRNVKCISFLGNGDGMNVISSSDVLLDGVFNRNSDDCVTVYATRLGFTGGSRSVTVQHSTLWADVAHPILVGTHGNTPNPEAIEDLRFIDLDILDHKEAQLDYQGCLSLNAGDSNLIRNVRFENIRIEDFRHGQLVNLRVFYNRKYCTSPGRGIENVLFKNVTYTGSHAEQSIICGYDEQHPVRNVVFENLVINGRLISDTMKKPSWFKTSDMARFFVGEHVDGISFRDPAPSATAAERSAQ